MKSYFNKLFLFLILFFASTATLVRAQDLRELARIILELPRTYLGNQQIVIGQVYGARIDAIITDSDNDSHNFSGTDIINIRISSVREEASLTFQGSGDEFDQWVRDNFDQIFALFFPTSISESVTGSDIARQHSQQFLMDKVLSDKFQKYKLGGLLEYEWFEVDSILGNAYQGIIYFDNINFALRTRYVRFEDHLGTNSWSFGLDYYPNLALENEILDFVIGINLFVSGLYSHNRAIDLGVIDGGLGFWTSVKKDFSRVRIGAGGIFQGSKSYIPDFAINDEFHFMVDEVNQRDPDFNLTYGAILGFALSDYLSLNGKIVQNHSFPNGFDDSKTSQTIILSSISYLIGGLVPLDVGFKTAFGLKSISANSVFVQGNFRW
jgi:hypothetical protein